MEKNFEGFRVLIARVEAGNGDAQGVERGVSAGRIGVGGDVHADFLARPVRLINVREALGEASFAAAKSGGRALSYEQAMDEVRTWLESTG